jgi:hypothetical protein
MRKAYFGILVGKRERKRPLGRPMGRWEDNIRMDLGEVGLKNVYWMHQFLKKDSAAWNLLIFSNSETKTTVTLYVCLSKCRQGQGKCKGIPVLFFDLSTTP